MIPPASSRRKAGWGKPRARSPNSRKKSRKNSGAKVVSPTYAGRHTANLRQKMRIHIGVAIRRYGWYTTASLRIGKNSDRISLRRDIHLFPILTQRLFHILWKNI